MIRENGFTLIETLIYIALFTIIIGGAMVAVYQIIESTNRTNERVVIQEDVNFLLRKLDWALTGASAVSATATTLTVTKGGSNLVFELTGDDLTLDTKPLNSSFVKVEPVAGIVFTYDSGERKVTTVFTINGRQVDQIKYLKP
ncbi:MAG: hypothetical protein A3B10_02355 [Candidatus Doudnabacteria bacterium RIFCSPLOWO2_01_FULL_44_21]|uniref:Prepilin-type N-terminal cleavage/methylation domain-containing protein n=1 Tax=Candidatus Doudnabacteria bacterium RIFCSPLOWO2_01_FULL_44_21 TaxID=1817841 RepID=A0A1F5PX28_9BACT|nr:MAG: hypothetical protein A3B95_02690 [Candidatus Doudnabacteria bacterium RIFCSPHIGHO2_02_FULL_43_13b]OGE94478.1 MAG: hypothetical protein A3B10_02355 [Candidatus Doudnabacteria bacterium RIFCSPLOWO2_01_FULL_44_21]